MHGRVKTGDYGFFERPKGVRPKVGARYCKPRRLLVVEVDVLGNDLKHLSMRCQCRRRGYSGGIYTCDMNKSPRVRATRASAVLTEFN